MNDHRGSGEATGRSERDPPGDQMLRHEALASSQKASSQDQSSVSGPDSADGTGAEAKSSHPLNQDEDSEASGTPDVEATGGRLQALGAMIRDQNDLERNINRQADHLLMQQANERDRKRLDRVEREKSELERRMRQLNSRLETEPNMGPATSRRMAETLSNLETQIQAANSDIEDITSRIESREMGPDTGTERYGGSERLPTESHREFLIRTGKITPFAKKTAQDHGKDLRSALLYAETGHSDPEADENQGSSLEFRSHRNLLQPGFEDSEAEASTGHENRSGIRSAKRRRTVGDERAQAEQGKKKSDKHFKATGASDSASSYARTNSEASGSGSESESPELSDNDSVSGGKRKRVAHAKEESFRAIDDGNESHFQLRLQKWVKRRSAARRRAQDRRENDATERDEESKEWHLPHPTVPDQDLGNGIRIPGDIWPALFDYQKTGVQWLFELFAQRVGGIVGDEMGLGKTVQVIAFLAGLHYSKKLDKPVIVVAPATVLKQWVKEFHTWWPALRVSILHSSGSGMMNIARESRLDDDISSQNHDQHAANPKQARAARKIVQRVVDDGHVLVTTYSGLQIYARQLLDVSWECAILDEGHTIRNPNTALTIHCKQLHTPHRIILSGTPIQNNLVELWSLFDFVFPMRLGNLVDFKNTFETPIRIGGYANASNLEVQTANKCAEALKDAISPYLLQRNKVDVAADLPKKTERVLFCRLTKQQREAYELFLESFEMNGIMEGRRHVLYGVDILRKICNHPDLQEHRKLSVRSDYKYGSSGKSGKMVVVRELINVWKSTGHKTLLFSQHRIMLDILEAFVKRIGGINYRRMDGSTPITQRQVMIDEFNNSPDIHLFLLTTKVGGLGTNLTGADRVIIFDPDWNPSTDIQARERAWRLGQKREVEIYRLMMAGTIEEKIFHRQIFKQFLSNKILRDPKQRQTFQMQDLHDLFTLSSSGEIESETGKLFHGAETRYDDHQSTPTKTSQPKIPALEPATKGKLPAMSASAVETKQDEKEQANIHQLDGVSSIRDFVPPDSDGEPASEATAGASKDAQPADDESEAKGKRNSSKRIMSALFARSGVTSTFDHEDIVNGSSKHTVRADARLIEREAARIAREATAKLKRSETEARSMEAGTVTWTGDHGTAGRPIETQRRAGPASSRLLQNLRERKEENRQQRAAAAVAAAFGSGPEPGSSRENTPTTGPRPQMSQFRQAQKRQDAQRAAQRDALHESATRFAKDLRTFLLAQGGRAHTQMVIDAFAYRCNNERKTQELLAILREMATLDKGTRGRGVWNLKEEYR